MPVGSDTYAYRGRLPHLVHRDKTYFVTFVTYRREFLPGEVRDVVLDCCVAAHGSRHWLHCAIVMPDHVHLLLAPFDSYSLRGILQAIKGSSAHRVNSVLQRQGKLWQRESFDHIIRSDESLVVKANYICQNPVRKGLVTDWHDYRWIWRAV